MASQKLQVRKGAVAAYIFKKELLKTAKQPKAAGSLVIYWEKLMILEGASNLWLSELGIHSSSLHK